MANIYFDLAHASILARIVWVHVVGLYRKAVQCFLE